MSVKDYNKLLTENITKTYKKVVPQIYVKLTSKQDL